MADWADGDVIKAVTRLRTATGEDVMNVFHWKWAGEALSDTTGISTIRAHLDAIYDFIESNIPSDVTFVGIDITNVTAQTFYGETTWPSLTVGGGTGDTMPEQNCALVTATTNRSKTLGKKFLGPFIETLNDDGSWASALIAPLTSFLAGYIADIELEGLGVLRPVLAHYVGNVLTYVTDIVGGSTSNGVFSQRRRRRGVGI